MTRRRNVRRWLTEPTVHFILIGTLLFAGSRWLMPRRPEVQEAPARRPILVSAARLDELRAGFRRGAGADPTPAQSETLIAGAVAEEILYREALARGLDRHERGVRARLIHKMQFLDSDPERTHEELYRDALALGLDREDVVVRRILVEKMRLVLQHSGGGETPAEAALVAYLERHRERFMQGARVSFSHVFLSADRRGEMVENDARRLLARLRHDGAPAARADEIGDPFALGHRVGARARHEIESAFGVAFADRVLTLEPGSWCGPVRSAYGLHLVRIEARAPARRATLSEVRNRVLQEVLAERRKQRLERGLRRLRELYEVRIEDSSQAGGERS